MSRRARVASTVLVAALIVVVAGVPPAAAHTVRPGETVSELAARHGVSVAAIAAANALADVDHIVAGTTLRIPAPAGAERFPAALRATPERQALVPTFQRWAAEYDVPVDLLMAMSWVESGWQNHVVSSAGARGIGQLMPDTVDWMREIVLRAPVDAAVAEDNVRMSARYLRWLLDRSGGDVRLALAGYFQGPASVADEGVGPRTERYVDTVVAFRRHFGA